MTMDFTTTYDQGKETPLLSTMDGKNDNIGAADGMSPEHGSTDHNSSITNPGQINADRNDFHNGQVSIEQKQPRDVKPYETNNPTRKHSLATPADTKEKGKRIKVINDKIGQQTETVLETELMSWFINDLGMTEPGMAKHYALQPTTDFLI